MVLEIKNEDSLSSHIYISSKWPRIKEQLYKTDTNVIETDTYLRNNKAPKTRGKPLQIFKTEKEKKPVRNPPSHILSQKLPVSHF